MEKRDKDVAPQRSKILKMDDYKKRTGNQAGIYEPEEPSQNRQWGRDREVQKEHAQQKRSRNWKPA